MLNCLIDLKHVIGFSCLRPPKRFSLLPLDGLFWVISPSYLHELVDSVSLM
jgi:hypothetical protein